MDDWHVDPRKILDYLLRETSPAGAAKNRFFRAGGFTHLGWQSFSDALIAHPQTARLEDIDASSFYGEKRTFRCRLVTPNGRDPCIRTVWQRRDGDYWLVTAYPFD
jgi:hypothetical protein